MHSAPYELAYDTDALKFLESVPPRKIKGQIKRRIDALANDPIPSGAKKLQGITRKNGPIYRVRQGHYRIVYEVRDDTREVVILVIDHRKDAYRHDFTSG